MQPSDLRFCKTLFLKPEALHPKTSPFTVFAAKKGKKVKLPGVKVAYRMHFSKRAGNNKVAVSYSII